MAENDIEALAVEQVDRDAAKSLLGRDDAGPSWWSIDSGNADRDPLVQAFARHRLTALRSTTTEPAPAVAADGELLPCPFCGGDAAVTTYETESLWSHNQVTYTKVGCCECDVYFNSEPGFEPEAPQAWSRRHPTDSAAKDAEIAAYREALEKIERTPAWGYPDRWETTPAEVRQLARAALANRGEAGALAKERLYPELFEYVESSAQAGCATAASLIAKARGAA